MSRDKEKHKEAKHQWYLRNKEKTTSSTKKHREAFQFRRKQWFYDLKSTKECLRCGEKRTPCLEFHHPEVRNGDEVLRVSYILGTGWSRKRILEEIEKCEVLCANCHKIEHWDEEKLNYSKLH